MFKLDVDGENWKYAFCGAYGFITSEGREEMLRETIRLYKKGDKSTKIKGNEYEGKITQGKFFTFGTCAGRSYDAELDTDKGKYRAKVLIGETTNIGLN